MQDDVDSILDEIEDVMAQSGPRFFAGIGARTLRLWIAIVMPWRDHEAEFDHATAVRISSALSRAYPALMDLAAIARGPLHTRDVAARAVTQINAVTLAATEAIRLLCRNRAQGGTMHEDTAVTMETHLLSLIANNAAEQRLIQWEFRDRSSPVPQTRPEREAVRMREYRRRKKLGVRQQLRVDLFQGDVDLLRRYGFLKGRDPKDQAAMTATLEDFLLAALLTFPNPSVSAEERIARAFPRLQAHLPPTDEDGIADDVG